MFSAAAHIRAFKRILIITTAADLLHGEVNTGARNHWQNESGSRASHGREEKIYTSECYLARLLSSCRGWVHHTRRAMLPCAIALLVWWMGPPHEQTYFTGHLWINNLSEHSNRIILGNKHTQPIGKPDRSAAGRRVATRNSAGISAPQGGRRHHTVKSGIQEMRTHPSLHDHLRARSMKKAQNKRACTLGEIWVYNSDEDTGEGETGEPFDELREHHHSLRAWTRDSAHSCT